MLKLTVLLFTLFLAPGRGLGQPTISNEAATKIVMRFLEDMSANALPLGNLSIIRMTPTKDRPDLSKGEIHQALLADIQRWTKLGILRVSQSQDLSKEFTNWDDWFALTQQNVAARVTVTTTPVINNYAQCSKAQRLKAMGFFGKQDFMCLPQGQLAADKIVSNEIRTIGVDHYAIVMGTYSLEFTPLMKSYYALLGSTPRGKMKFVAALKFNPFDSDWIVVALDRTSRESEFFTNSVNRLLATPVR